MCGFLGERWRLTLWGRPARPSLSKSSVKKDYRRCIAKPWAINGLILLNRLHKTSHPFLVCVERGVENPRNMVLCKCFPDVGSPISLSITMFVRVDARFAGDGGPLKGSVLFAIPQSTKCIHLNPERWGATNSQSPGGVVLDYDG